MQCCTLSVDLVVGAHRYGLRRSDCPMLSRSSPRQSSVISAKLILGRLVPSDGKYPSAVTTISVPEISVKIAHVDVLHASGMGYRQHLLLPTAGWLHLHRADTEAEATCLHHPSCSSGHNHEAEIGTTQPMWCHRYVSIGYARIAYLFIRRRLLTIFSS